MEESEIPCFPTTTFAILVYGQRARQLDENSGTKDPEMKFAILVKCCNGKLQYLLRLVIQVVGCHWYCDVLCMVLHKLSSGVSAVIGAVSSLILWVSWS